MVGNHHDAWTFGSVDPNNGTTVLLELSRALNQLKKSKQWTPKRSVMFLRYTYNFFKFHYLCIAIEFSVLFLVGRRRVRSNRLN